MLEDKREELRQQWEHGKLSDWDSHSHAIINAGNIGECKGYAFVSEMDFEQFIGELEDGEFIRPETPGEGGVD